MGYTRYVGAVSGATLGYVAGNVPGAVAGARYGYKKGEEYENLPKNSRMAHRAYPTPTTGTRKRKLSVSSGVSRVKKRLFVGKGQRKAFIKAVGPVKRAGKRRVTRRRRPTKSRPKRSLGKESYFQAKGFLNCLEQYGIIDDPDSVYITHSTATLNLLGETIAQSLMRTILTHAGFKVTNLYQELPATNPAIGVGGVDNSESLRFIYVARNQVQGTFTTYEYITPDNQTYLNVLKGFVSLTNHMIDLQRNSSNDQPHKLAVYKRDFGALSTNWNLGAEMYLEDCNLELYYGSVLTLQNRSKGALIDGTSAEQLQTDRVDTQPLKGYLYNFKHADPRLRHSSTNLVAGLQNNTNLSAIPDFGLSLIRGAQFTPGQEPLNPKYFANIESSSSITLSPGAMKKFNFMHNPKGRFTNVIKKLRSDVWFDPGVPGQPGRISGLLGKSQMVCFEEVMRTESANLISIAFEREIKLGCVCTYKRTQNVLELNVISQTVNNITP